ncbi:MAG: sugar phosphate isomerase/epimerase family protein [Pirellulales bacterium]
MSRFSSRRDFLCLSAAVAGGAMLGMQRRVWGEDKAEEFPGFKLGIQSYSLRGYGVDEAIKHAGEIGFTTIEFFGGHYPLESTDEQITQMNEKLASAKLEITAHGVNGFGADHAANKKVFDFAKRAGIKNISADPSPDSFDSLDKLVAEYDIRIAIHNHGPSHRYDKAIDVLNAVKNHHPHIGACADLGHYIRSGEDPVAVIRLLKGRLFGIHLKDFAEQKAQTKGVILGRGHMDVVGVFKALKEADFPIDGGLSLEYEENPDNPLDDIRECFAIATDAAKQVRA